MNNNLIKVDQLKKSLTKVNELFINDINTLNESINNESASRQQAIDEIKQNLLTDAAKTLILDILKKAAYADSTAIDSYNQLCELWKNNK